MCALSAPTWRGLIGVVDYTKVRLAAYADTMKEVVHWHEAKPVSVARIFCVKTSYAQSRASHASAGAIECSVAANTGRNYHSKYASRISCTTKLTSNPRLLALQYPAAVYVNPLVTHAFRCGCAVNGIAELAHIASAPSVP